MLCCRLESKNHLKSQLKQEKMGRGVDDDGNGKKRKFGKQLDYELYIKTIRYKENDRGMAGMSRTSSVALDASKRFFSLLKLPVRLLVSESDPLCS